MSDSTPLSIAPRQPISLKDATRFWWKLGWLSFGGPAGQIALMHRELVDERRWISEGRFLHALNYCMVLPGPEAQQLATYIGWLMHRTVGGVVAGGLFVLPSLLVLIGLSWLYVAYGSVPWIAALFAGIKPAVAMVVLQAAYRIGSRVLKNYWLWGVAISSFTASAWLQAPFPAVVAIAALLGVGLGRWRPSAIQAGGHARNACAISAPAFIDDDTPTPSHALFRWGQVGIVAASGGALWLAPMLSLIALKGWHNPLTQMGWFFSKAALLTFGGAYAVLPYVYHGAVIDYQWLSAAQMMDGLALGEATPGPLIMIVAFVGFLGAYFKAALGPDALVWAGVLGAALVTWFTFLPSFVFILAGGPAVESSRQNLKLTAPLTAITAAVVGVIANLALFFVQNTLWPAGMGSPINRAALVIMLIAGCALFYWKRSVIQVIVLSAALGLVGYALSL